VVKRRVEMGSRHACREPPQSGLRGILRGEEGIPRGMLHAVNEMPIVEPSATTRFLVHVETNRMNDVETCAERRGGSPDVSRVIRDLGVQENDVQKRPQRSPARSMRSRLWDRDFRIASVRLASALQKRQCQHSAIEFVLRERALESRSGRAILLRLTNAQETPHDADDDPESVGEEDGNHGRVPRSVRSDQIGR